MFFLKSKKAKVVTISTSLSCQSRSQLSIGASPTVQAGTAEINTRVVVNVASQTKTITKLFDTKVEFFRFLTLKIFQNLMCSSLSPNKWDFVDFESFSISKNEHFNFCVNFLPLVLLRAPLLSWAGSAMSALSSKPTSLYRLSRRSSRDSTTPYPTCGRMLIIPHVGECSLSH